MGATVSGKSEMTRSDVARIFAAAAFKKADNAVIIEYESNARVVKGIDQNDRLFSIVDKLHGPAGGTSLAAALEQVKPYLQDIDMIYILTDEQSWIPSHRAGGFGYRADHAHIIIADLMKQKKCLRVVNHNLASYGTSDLPSDTRILDLGGWSDQVFNVIDSWHKGGMVEYIKNWTLNTEVIED
jgi:60 kDa SS-A/Ro ribonucleoprotein